MANGPKVEITLNTTATGTGVEDTVAGLDRVEKKATAMVVKMPGADPKTAPAIQQTTAALEKEAATADKAAKQLNEVAKAEKAIHQEADTGRAARRNVETFLKETEPLAKKTTIAFYDLDKALTATGNVSQGMANGMSKMTKPTRDNATALLMFSQGLEDAQYGIRGVLNNIPGLVMALGGKAGLAGGISIAAVALTTLFSLFSKGKEEAEKFEVDLGEIADNYADNIMDKLAKADAARVRAASMQDIGKTPDTAGRDAEQRAFDARQESITILIEVTRTLNELMGRQVVAQEAIAAAEAERARQREEEQARQIELEKQKVGDARQALQVAERQRELYGDSITDAQRELDKQWQKVEALRAQRDELKKIAAMPLPSMAAGDNPILSEAGAAAVQKRKREAQRQLDANEKGSMPVELEGAEKAVKKLEADLERLWDTFSNAAQLNVDKAAQDLERQEAATQENIETILKQGQMKQAADMAKTAVEADASIAKQVRETIEMVDANAKEQRPATLKAAESLKDLLIDNKITLDEIPRVITAMQTIQANFRGEIVRMMSVTEQAVATGNANAARLLRLEQMEAQGRAMMSPAPRPR